MYTWATNILPKYTTKITQEVFFCSALINLPSYTPSQFDLSTLLDVDSAANWLIDLMIFREKKQNVVGVNFGNVRVGWKCVCLVDFVQGFVFCRVFIHLMKVYKKTIYGGLRTSVGLVLRGFLFPNIRKTGAT